MQIKIFEHRGGKQIGFYFPKGDLVLGELKKKFQVKWSATYRCWYTAYTEDKHAIIQNSIFKSQKGTTYFISKGPKSETFENESKTRPPGQEAPIQKKNNQFSKKLVELSPGNKVAMEKMRQLLILKGYSPNTQKTYLNEFMVFVKTLQHVPAHSMTQARLKDYFQYCHEKLKLSENTIHSRINALKFYYEQVLEREKFFYKIPRPRKKLQLPAFFTRNEVLKIINGTKNLKHKAMLMLAYGGGLRVSEVIKLKPGDTDSDRMSIWIRGAKGNKDRIVPLSPALLIILRSYAFQYNIGKKGWLFPGEDPNNHYTTRSLQMVLKQAKERAGLTKEGGIHALRHSFATHLLDSGNDVTLIMKLLGHNDLKTTLRYLHVTNRDILKIVSPLDDLDLDI